MRYIGSHVSASGGVENAPLNAYNIGANGFAFFTRNQRQWDSPALTQRSISLFKERCEAYGFVPESILPHDSYLINLGHPEAVGLEKSRAAFLDEMSRCEQLGLTMLNFHPGSHLKLISEEQCMDIIADSINWALERVPRVAAIIENTAGQGSNIGYRFEQLAYIIDRVADKTRVGVCLDTCHTFTSGYDFLSADDYDRVFNSFDQIVGFKYLKAIHLNDSKKALSSRVDRHESIGRGYIGMEFFERVMKDSRMDNIPIILETPDESLWKDEISLLRSMI